MQADQTPRHAAAAPAACRACGGTGLVDVDHCNCGSPADSTVNYAHERLCGAEPCPNGCWDRLHAEAAAPAPAGELVDLRVLAYETYFTSIGGPMDGNPLPCTFGELDLAERIAWTDVVGAIRDALDAAVPQAAPDLTARLAAVTALLDASHKRDWDSGLASEQERVADERAGLGMGAL